MNILKTHVKKAMFIAIAGWVLFSVCESAETPPYPTSNPNGLYLVVGVKKVDFIEKIVQGTNAFVHVLLENEKDANRLASRIATGPYREQVSVRNGKYDLDVYDGNLFDTVIIGKEGASIDPEQVFRITRPGGVVWFTSPTQKTLATARRLGSGSTQWKAAGAVFVKKVLPAPSWKPPLALKWRGGPRTQKAGALKAAFGGDTLFCLERMEDDSGSLAPGKAVVIARGAYNGHILWLKEVGNWARWIGIAADEDGNVFVKIPIGRYCKLLKLSGRSGKTLFEIKKASTNTAALRCIEGRLLTLGGKVYSRQTGKHLWTLPSYRWLPLHGAVLGDHIYFFNGKTLQKRQLEDGKIVQEKALKEVPQTFMVTMKFADLLMLRPRNPRNPLQFYMVDPKEMKVLWKYDPSQETNNWNFLNSRFHTYDKTLFIYQRRNQKGSYIDEIALHAFESRSGKHLFDKIIAPAGDFHGCFRELHFGRYIVYYDLWVDLKKFEIKKIHMPHPACFIGSLQTDWFVYDFPSRKSGPVTAVGPADPLLPDTNKRLDILKSTGIQPSTTAPTEEKDWPMFRGSIRGGNASPMDLGTELQTAWDTRIGTGTIYYGLTMSRPTGLTQAVTGYGLAITGDIDANRVVAVEMSSGKIRWVRPVGGRVEYPPTMYKGRCLVGAKDGWIYCMDAVSGKLLWKRLAAPAEYYIGGWNKIESMWPVVSDILVANGKAYAAAAAGIPDTWKGTVSFDPATGKLLSTEDAWTMVFGNRRGKSASPRRLLFSHTLITKGNSIPRTQEDNVGGFKVRLQRGLLDGRVLAFDDTMVVRYAFKPAGEAWNNKGRLSISAFTDSPRKAVWKISPIELIVDDMVLTPQHIYCAGHYQRIDKKPELWIISRKTGKIEKTVTLPAIPAFLGMSLAQGNLLISTRDGRLLCLKPSR